MLEFAEARKAADSEQRRRCVLLQVWRARQYSTAAQVALADFSTILTLLYSS